MPKYWCRFFDANNQVIWAERVVVLDDAAAIVKARAAAPEAVARFEVWRNVNFIHEEAWTNVGGMDLSQLSENSEAVDERSSHAREDTALGKEILD